MVATFNIIFLEFLGNYADNFFCVTLVWKRRKIQFQGTLKDFQMSFNFLDINYFFKKTILRHFKIMCPSLKKSSIRYCKSTYLYIADVRRNRKLRFTYYLVEQIRICSRLRLYHLKNVASTILWTQHLTFKREKKNHSLEHAVLLIMIRLQSILMYHIILTFYLLSLFQICGILLDFDCIQIMSFKWNVSDILQCLKQNGYFS